MREGYKETEIGEIPTDWTVGIINDYVESFKGGAALTPSDFVQQDGFPVIPKKAIVKGGKLIIDLQNPTFCSNSFANSNTNNLIDKSYIVTTLRDLVPSAPSIGYMVQFDSDENYILAQGVYGFKVNENINRAFLIQYSNTSKFRKVMQKIKVGSTQVHIRNTDYFGVFIPIPPLSEQQKIAEILSTVDDKINVIDKQISETQTLKKGLMHRLLTKGIGHTEFKDSPLGEIPMSWEVVKLESVCLPKEGMRRGPFGGAIKKEFFVDHGFQVYEQRNAIYDDFESARYFINESKYNELKAFRIKANDFIISCSGTIGKIAKVPEVFKKGIINQALLRLRIKTEIIDNNFFLQQFRFEPFQNIITDSTQGGAMKNLVGMSEFRKTLIVLPPKTEQQIIANILTIIDDKLTVLVNKKTHYQELKQGLMQQLLTGKIRVNGLINKPNME